MTPRLVMLATCATAAMLAGCAARPTPSPGKAAVAIDVRAKPKAGVKQRLVRVTVYDAAPAAAPAPAGAYENVDYATLGDIVVWLEPAPNDAPARPVLTVAVDANRPSETLRVATVGQTIRFRNASLDRLSFYSVSDDNDFELPPLETGGEAEYVVRAPGLIEVLADPSQPPVALVYAVPSPWVARTRSGETVVFEDVTPGTYQVLSWHPRLPGSTANLTLAEGQAARVTLAVGVNALGRAE